jgi:CHAT domain-containing protein
MAEMSLFLGMQYEKSGRIDDAKKAYAEAAAALRAMKDTHREILVRLKGASIRLEDGIYLTDFDELALLRKEVVRLDDPGISAYFHDAIGRIYFYEEKWAVAAGELRAAIKAAERRFGNLEDPLLKASSLSRSVNALYAHLAIALKEDGEIAASLQAAERAKGRALMDMIERSKTRVLKGMSREEQSEETNLREAVASATTRSQAAARFGAGNREELQAIAKELTEAEARYEEFRQQIYLTHRDLRAKRGELPEIDLKGLQKTLFKDDPDLAILSYIVSWDRLMIFVVTAGDKPDGAARIAIHSVMVDEKVLAEAAEEFLKDCREPGEGGPISAKLWNWLIAPAEKELAGKKQLVIAPCLPLLTLPFQAMRKKDGPYLIEKYALSYAPSIAALVEMRRQGDKLRAAENRGRVPVVAIGGAKFSRDLKPLPNSGPEAVEIGKLFGELSVVLLGDRATRDETMREAGSARFLHIATHGLVNSSRPLFSALATTPKNDDGRLFAHDIMNLDISAEMVVLSACETALGREFRGEGTIGLSWAFFVAALRR